MSGACNACSKDQTSRRLTPIGRPVVVTTQVGRGHDQTEHTFLQCGDCG